jgi:hypothetical protein
MRRLLIQPTAATDKPGDLRAIVRGDKILLSERVVNALTPLGIRTAVDLVVYLASFPSTVAGELGWDIGDVQHALELLRRQLKGIVDDSILYPPVRPEPFSGALDPSTLKKHKNVTEN